MKYATLGRYLVSKPSEKYAEQIKKIASLKERYFVEDGFNGAERPVKSYGTRRLISWRWPQLKRMKFP